MDGIGQGADAVFGTLGMFTAGIMAALLVLGLAAFAVAFHILLRRPERHDAEALAALAARRGWVIERQMAVRGKGFRLAIAPQDGASWSCRVTRYINVGRGGTVRTTEFEDKDVRLPAGLVVVGPGLPASERKAGAAVLGMLGDRLERMLAAKLLGDELADQMPELRLAKSGLSDATVFATPGAPIPRIAAALAPLLDDWRKDRPQEKDFPILILTPEGLRVRLRTDAATEPLLSAFLDLALTIRERLAPGALRRDPT